jgi:methionine sulfoxide reductase heme-binding subunit
MLPSHVTTLATATGPHVFWLASRAAGIVALTLSSVSVGVGLLMSTQKGIGGRLRRAGGAELRVAHEALSLAVLGALAVHGLTLLGDSYLHPSLADIAVPFASSYRTFWTTTGIVAFWALALLGLSYYLRARIGVQRWRRLHRLTAVAWLLGLVHSLGEGTDAGQTWFLAMTAIAVAPPLALLIARWWERSAETPSAAETGSRRGAPRRRAATGQP